ncbi:MAG: MBOAT family protein [Lachnospiraceae bacterium]|nr:MBOAT family protein [Lachnospiraceae bacterium]
MVFSSVIFLFFFLPAVYIMYCLCSDIRMKNALLIMASLFFYAFGEPVYVILMTGSILTNYAMARLIAGYQKRARIFLCMAVVFNLGLLVFFKYAALIIQTIRGLSVGQSSCPEIALPIGISFYTFQALSYCVDVYRDRGLVQKNVWKLMLYISFFPQLIAGPIVKYHDIEKQLSDRAVTIGDTAVGIRRFICGLGKKLLIANSMAYIVDTLYTTQINMALTAWVSAVCYIFQIYFDFSGYSDMAIGLGRMFGFTFQENFQYPYVSTGIREFWRRWHISLSTWFKEYLYIPLGGNRKGKVRTTLNKLVVFMATGIWHGADWTFLLWGLFHGLFITLEDHGLVPFKNRISAHIYTMFVIICGFVIFRADTIGQAVHIFGAIFTGFHMEVVEMMILAKLLTPWNVACAIVAAVLSTPVSCWLKQTIKNEAVYYTASLVLLAVCIMELASGSYNPFIYFRF